MLVYEVQASSAYIYGYKQYKKVKDEALLYDFTEAKILGKGDTRRFAPLGGIFGMKIVSLDDACELVTDGTHYTPPDIGEGIPFLTVKDISEQGLDFSGCSHISLDEYKKADLGNSSPKVGDVLFSKDGTVGKVHVVSENQSFAVLSSIAILRPKKDILDSNYFGYILKSPLTLDQAIRRKTGSAIRRIILNDLKQVQIPLPPIEEQRRLTAILDKADAVRKKRQQAIKLTEELLRAAFLDMFGDPVTNSKQWQLKPLGEICNRVTVGYVGTMASEYIDEGVPWLRSLNVNRNRIVLNDLKYVSNKFHQKVIKSSLSPGDVVAVRTGNAGVAAVVPASLPHANCSDLIIMTCGMALVPTYLSETLNLLLGDRDGGDGLTGAIQKHFNITRAKQLMIPLPPLEDQNKWTTLVNKMENFQQTQAFNQKESQNLFNSLIHRAFRGEL